MAINKTIPEIYQPLFLPNWTPEEQKRFTPAYKEELRRRLILGSGGISESELGVQEIVLKGGRISGKTKNDELSSVPLFFGDKGDMWYCRSEDSTIRTSIFASMQETLYSLGFTLSNSNKTDFKVSYSPFQITCNATGNTMQFFGINKDINRTKGKFPPSGRLNARRSERA